MSYAKSNIDYYSDDKPLRDYEDVPFEECGDFFDRPVNDSRSHSFPSQDLPGDLYASYRRIPHVSPPDYLPYLPPDTKPFGYDRSFLLNSNSHLIGGETESPQSQYQQKKQEAGQSSGRITSNNASAGHASTSRPYTQSQTGHSFPNYQNQTPSSSRNIQSHPSANPVPAHMGHPSRIQRHSNAPVLPLSPYAASSTPQPVSNTFRPGWHSNRPMTPVSHRQRTPEPNLFVETLEQKVNLLSQSPASVSSSPARKTPRKGGKRSTRSISDDVILADDVDDRPIAQRRGARRAALNNTYCRGSSSAA